VARVAVQLLARSIRRAGCMTCVPGPPCWACWKSEKCTHLARLHAACMAARPFTRWFGRKWRDACNRWTVACTACGGLASSALGQLA
jgi:Tfp pilus assembly protein PilW